MRKSLILLLLVLSSCSQPQQDAAKQLTLNIVDDPTTLDPHGARDLTSSTLCPLFLEGLTHLGKDGLEPGIATHWEANETHTRYTFFLREAKWSDGSPVTAYDFVRSWQRAASKGFVAPQAFLLYPIKNCQAIKKGELSPELLGALALDNKTLRVDLEHPTPNFAELVSMRMYLPVHREATIENPLPHGNGPFTLEAWHHDDEIIATRNPFYWDAEQVHLDRIRLIMVERDTGLALYENGEVEWVGEPLSAVPNDALASWKSSEELSSFPVAATAFLRVNVEAVKELNTRRALSQAIDRAALCEHVLAGGQPPAQRLLPPSLASGEPFEPPAISELTLEQPLTLSFAKTERNQKVAEALQDQWRKALNTHIRLQPIEPKVFYTNLRQGNYELALSTWFADMRDPLNFLEVFEEKDSGINNTGWESADYQQLLKLARVEGSREKRERLIASAERVLLSEQPIIPLYHYTFTVLQSPALTGVHVSELGTLNLKRARLQ